MSHDDFEPVAGLPEALPKGEHMLWQGSPQWRSLALRAFRIREVAVYFAALMSWRLVAKLSAGAAVSESVQHALDLVPLLLAVTGILAGIAWLSAKSTLYTITTERIVMRYGMAVPLVLNIPFSRVETALAGDHGDGTGSIVLTLCAGERLGYLVLWPHARPWRYARPEPMLRCLPDAAVATNALAAALADHNGVSRLRHNTPTAPERAPILQGGFAGVAGGGS